MAETQRQQALAEQVRQQRRADSEVTLDEKGDMHCTTFGGLWRIARMYACSSMVPARFRVAENGEDAIGDCAIGIQMAMRLNCSIMAFLQSCYIVHGTPGIESKLAVTLLLQSGKVRGRLRYAKEFDGNGKVIGCRASVTTKDGEDIEGTAVTWDMVEKEGWSKDGKTSKGATIYSKWNTMPELMFEYRSAMFLIRSRFPDVIMGMQSKEELEDVHGPILDEAIKQTIAQAASANREDLSKLFQEQTAEKPKKQPAQKQTKKRGRPKGSKNKPKPAATEESAAEPKDAPAPAQEPEQGDPETTTQHYKPATRAEILDMCGLLDLDQDTFDHEKIAAALQDQHSLPECREIVDSIAAKTHPDWQKFVPDEGPNPEPETIRPPDNVATSPGDTLFGADDFEPIPEAEWTSEMRLAKQRLDEYTAPDAIAKLYFRSVEPNDKFSDQEARQVFEWADDRIKHLTKNKKQLDDFQKLRS